MNERSGDVVVERRVPNWLAAVSLVALLAALGALLWALTLQNHLATAERNLMAATQQNGALAEKIDDTNERLRAQGEALGQSVGLTQKQLEERSQELVTSQKSAQRLATQANAATSRLSKETKANTAQIGAVQNDVSSVKTDVGGVKQDVASTQADLSATKGQLTRVVGDQGVMSGLIATNHEELQELRRRGERNYYEFTLDKNIPKVVGTTKLTLKKSDVNRSKYNLFILADDKNIEKKDKNLDEPVQFYSGKSPALFEIVINNMKKDQVTGYLSTPKSVPGPVALP